MKFLSAKRNRFILFALLQSAVLYLYINEPGEKPFWLILLILTLVVAGSFLVYLPNTKTFGVVVSTIPSVHLALGMILSLIFFPNLSVHFKVLSLVLFIFLSYLISLVTNIFMVVESRKEIIPLHRVAVTWSKILLITISIPFLAGIYKLPINTVYQSIITGVSSFLFFIYLIWFSRHNRDVKKYKVGEMVGIVGMLVFIIMSLSISVSFFPTESFLRALFISSVQIFGISYLEGHIKNTINKKMLTEHLAISIIFLVLLLIFKG